MHADRVFALVLYNSWARTARGTKAGRHQGFSRLLCCIAVEPTDNWSSGLSVGEAREERLARNEIAFRSVNERIQEMAVEFGGDDYEFVCECSAKGCLDRVTLTRVQYEHVRAEGTRFFVVPGHENVAVEEVVETHPTFLVVEKDGHAGVVADIADPRDGDP